MFMLYQITDLWRLVCTKFMLPKNDQTLENLDDDDGLDNTNLLESLSDDLIHLILELLTPVEKIRFSVLSRRLRSSWLSFPSLDYDLALFTRELSSFKNLAEFLNLVDKSLQLRGLCIKTRPLEKLRFIYNGLHTQTLHKDFESVVKNLLEFALENNARELELDIRKIILPFSYPVGTQSSPSFCNREGAEAISAVLEPVFSLQRVTILKLKGFTFPEPNLDLTSPSLELVTIDTCSGLKDIRVSSACSRLSKTEIRCCYGLKNVRVDAENIESFSFVGTCFHRVCQVDISACHDTLKDLTLKYAAVYEFLLQIHVYVLLENLNLSDCRMPTSLNIGSSSLRTLNLNNCQDMMKLVVSSEKLESFTCNEYWDAIYGIEISECFSLKNLQLCKARVTAGWLRDTISALTMLETLVLKSCTRLEKIEFRHDKLVRLELENHGTLKRAEIDARNLLQFSYSGPLEPFPLVITSSQYNVIIYLKEKIYKTLEWRFISLIKFLAYFNGCPSLTLSCSSAEDLIFLREYLWFTALPLPDTKHLTVELEKLPESAKVSELVESVLWIVPNPNTLTIVSGTKRYLLKFHFSNQVDRKCWRHHVGRIDMENFELEDRKNLEKLLFDGNLG